MKYITLPTAETRHLSFYLAMEEYVARHVDEPDCFFMWQVEPTVIFGRHQVVENEVNLAYCRDHAIKVYRRKSGGGCVYADQDNVMLSFITDGDNVGFAFNRFVQMLLLVLRKLGVSATGTSHNDILIGDRKVCGTACYHIPLSASQPDGARAGGRSIVHSTMLYDTNMAHMLNAITPSHEKLQSKGVESVRQRITLLKDHTPLPLSQVKTLIRQTLCDGERMLTANDIARIEQLEQDYLREDYISLLTNH